MFCAGYDERQISRYRHIVKNHDVSFHQSSLIGREKENASVVFFCTALPNRVSLIFREMRTSRRLTHSNILYCLFSHSAALITRENRTDYRYGLISVWCGYHKSHSAKKILHRWKAIHLSHPGNGRRWWRWCAVVLISRAEHLQLPLLLCRKKIDKDASAALTTFTSFFFRPDATLTFSRWRRLNSTYGGFQVRPKYIFHPHDRHPTRHLIN